MASSGNFCTLNPSTAAYADLKEGNVRVTGLSASGNGYFQSTFGVSSGKWYAEMYAITMAFSHPSLGLTGGTQTRRLLSNEGMEPNLIWYAGNSSSKLVELSMDNDVWGTYSENESSVSTISATNVIMIALDADNKKLWYGVGGTWYNSGDPAANDGNWAQSWTTNPNSIHLSFGGYVNSDQVVNFGQDSTFGGRISAGGNADGNGFGDFKYSPPSGFLALCSGNLPISDDIDPAQNDDSYPGKLIGTSNWSGSGGSKSITGLGFQPDLTIIKAADAASSDWALFDSSRGVQKLLEPNTTTAEETNSNSLTAFGADGFTVGSDSRVNDSGRLMTAQSWICNAGTTASNSDGASTTTVQANTKAGFSIVEFPNYSSNSTFGHGLSSAPEFIITKLTASGSQWPTYHKGLTSAGYYVAINNSNAQASGSFFNSTAPTSSVFSLGASFGGSGAGIAYCFHGVEGYSKFSSYVGNGNADGPFIYTGHMPRCVWIKRTDSSAEWAVYFWNDTSVNSSYVSLKQNPLDSRLTFDAGSMNNGEPVDFLSNGFKIRDSDAIVNASSGNYLYSSWGSVPFKYNNTF